MFSFIKIILDKTGVYLIVSYIKDVVAKKFLKKKPLEAPPMAHSQVETFTETIITTTTQTKTITKTHEFI